LSTDLQKQEKETLTGPFFWLTAFYFVYCARPGDSISALGYIPMAKITGILALVSLVSAAGKAPRHFKDLPKEATYLFLMIALLFVSALLSPVWRGGAFFSTIDFSKVYVAWVLTFLLITTLKRLRRIIFIQSVSVIVVCLSAIVKGHSVPRLEGVIGGFYSNPNDMAFAIVLSLPFCLAFLLTAKQAFRKLLWCVGMLVAVAALVLTASRAGFIDLIVAGTVCLWHFGVRGKRLYLIGATLVLGAGLLLVAGQSLMHRFAAISGENISSQEQETARASYEERKLLMQRSLDAIAQYPILGVGVENFAVYSGMWKQVHASYLQIAAEGGIPILILYLMFFARGFSNLRQLNRVTNLGHDSGLFVGAMKASLIGFIVGACFAPEAYQYFPYFTVCYTSVFFAMSKERNAFGELERSHISRPGPGFGGTSYGRSSAFTPAG
jgi:O-antigen ligase